MKSVLERVPWAAERTFILYLFVRVLKISVESVLTDAVEVRSFCGLSVRGPYLKELHYYTVHYCCSIVSLPLWPFMLSRACLMKLEALMFSIYINPPLCVCVYVYVCFSVNMQGLYFFRYICFEVCFLMYWSSKASLFGVSIFLMEWLLFYDVNSGNIFASEVFYWRQ